MNEITGESYFVLKIGAEIKLFDGWITGKIIGFEKNKSVSNTWKPNDREGTADESLVEIYFEKNDKVTILTLKHAVFPNQKESDGHKYDYEEYVFLTLEAYLIYR